MSLGEWYVGLEAWKRRAAALLLLLAGPFLAWRSLVQFGSSNTCRANPDLATESCTTTPWEAWYRWPGVALGLLLILVAVLMLALAAREQRAARAKLTGRRAR